VKEIRASGGEIYAICCQGRKAVEDTKKELNLRYELVADPKNLLAKKYNMSIISQKGKKFRKFLNILADQLKKKPDIPDHEDGITMPGIIVMKQDGSVLYSWKAQPCENNLFGTIKRVNPADVLKIVQFYYANSTIVDSVKSYVLHHMYETFLQVLNDPEGIELFSKHLRKEFNEESLEFIRDVDQLNSNKDNADKIYLSYIPGGAQKELNLPGRIRRAVMTQFNDGHKISAFSPAYEHIKASLGEDSFDRFVNTEEFINIASRIIPKCFTSEAIDDICYI